MEGFTIVDAVVAVIILMSAILAYSRGFVREVLAIAGWVAAAVLAFIFAPQAEPLVKQIPVLDKFLGDSCELSIIAAFAGVFALSLIVMSIFTPVFASAVQRSALGGIDQALGFLTSSGFGSQALGRLSCGLLGHPALGFPTSSDIGRPDACASRRKSAIPG